jgi:DNA polymerase-3 subunit epsilon
MRNRRLTQRHFHHYLNPERDIDAGAFEVHGISLEFLQGKPRFADIAEEFLDFVRGAELVIHNAPFDVGFLDAELALLDLAPIMTVCSAVLDSLRLAKELHPGKRNNLDALCERYQIDNSKRALHGALLDAEILAEVYMAMTRGQESLIMDIEENRIDFPGAFLTHPAQGVSAEACLTRVVLRADEQELAEHARLLRSIQDESKEQCLWLALEDRRQ